MLTAGAALLDVRVITVTTSGPGYFDAAAGVTAWQVAAFALLGAGLGLASGFLATVIERYEKLEEEENEEREEYEKETAAAAAKAKEAGKEPEEALDWIPESYGWTWREKYLSPALGAVLFGLFTFHQGVATGLLIHLLWVLLFVHITAFDLKHRLILNIVTYPSIVLALALSPVTPGLTIGQSAVGAVTIAGAFLFLNILFRGGIGLGDAKLGGLIGAVAGLSFDLSYPQHFGAIYAAVWGVLLGGVVAVLLLITRIRGFKDPIPYGPFLCAGAVLVLYQGL